MLDFVAHRHLVLNHQQGIEYTGVTLIDDTVSMADMFYDLFAHAFVHQDYGVYPVIGRRLQCSHDIRRHILAEAATGLRHRPGSDTTSLASPARYLRKSHNLQS